MLGTKATIFMPEGAALPKVAATEGYGADIKFHGSGVTEALVPAREFAKETGAVLIHPFDHEDILVGQGTVGLEILEQCPDVKTILVPVRRRRSRRGHRAAAYGAPRHQDHRRAGRGRRGLSGVAAGGAPRAGRMGVTMADGISVAEPGGIPFDVIAELLDDVITVSEESMSRALISLLERAKMLVEPAGTAGVAAILEKPDAFEGPVVSVLSGGNIDALVLLDVIRHGLAAAGRFLMFRVRISDRPGALMGLLTDLAEMQVNVLNVNHDRASESLGVRQVDVDMQVATRGPQHRAEVRKRLTELGYEFV